MSCRGQFSGFALLAFGSEICFEVGGIEGLGKQVQFLTQQTFHGGKVRGRELINARQADFLRATKRNQTRVFASQDCAASSAQQSRRSSIDEGKTFIERLKAVSINQTAQ